MASGTHHSAPRARATWIAESVTISPRPGLPRRRPITAAAQHAAATAGPASRTGRAA